MRTISGIALALCCACSSFSAQAPKGFATYEHGKDYRAVSPEGVVYRVRSVDNEPRADLAFWSEALTKRMLDAGYIKIAEQPVSARSQPGRLLELAAPLGSTDYAYDVAVFVDGDDLVLVEVAGEVPQVAMRRGDIIAAIEALNLAK